MLKYVEGNEELLEDTYDTLDEIFKEDSDHIKKDLQEKARWGSLRVVIAYENETVSGVGIATINNLNTGHIQYIMVRNKGTQIECNIMDKMIAWLNWLKVKSITVEREVIYS